MCLFEAKGYELHGNFLNIYIYIWHVYNTVNNVCTNKCIKASDQVHTVLC